MGHSSLQGRHRSVGLFLILVLSPALFEGCGKNCREGLNISRPSESQYLLPYPVGDSAEVFQSYCGGWGHRSRMAYDFTMAMGSPITAARGGVVTEVRDWYDDEDRTAGHNNRVLIRHQDTTIAWYAHLQKGSLVVEEGDTVVQGQMIGRCGRSGRSGDIPHLHFEVFRRKPYVYAEAIPVNFRNARGNADANGILFAGVSYTAGPDSLESASYGKP